MNFRLGFGGGLYIFTLSQNHQSNQEEMSSADHEGAQSLSWNIVEHLGKDFLITTVRFVQLDTKFSPTQTCT